jgi:hypothetical protein
MRISLLPAVIATNDHFRDEPAGGGLFSAE